MCLCTPEENVGSPRTVVTWALPSTVLGTKYGSAGRSASAHILWAISPGPGIDILTIPVLEFQWLHLEASADPAQVGGVCAGIGPPLSQPAHGFMYVQTVDTRDSAWLYFNWFDPKVEQATCVERVKCPTQTLSCMGINCRACAHTGMCVWTSRWSVWHFHRHVFGILNCVGTTSLKNETG